jgi:hypothetical protein
VRWCDERAFDRQTPIGGRDFYGRRRSKKSRWLVHVRQLVKVRIVCQNLKRFMGLRRWHEDLMPRLEGQAAEDGRPLCGVAPGGDALFREHAYEYARFAFIHHFAE